MLLKYLVCKFKNYELYHDIINSLVKALEAKDVYTKNHSQRVGDMSYKLAKFMGIKNRQLEQIHIAGHVHDIGKIGIPDYILNKKEKLLPHEWEYIKIHPKLGYEILSQSKRLRNIANIVLCHHERWNGKGYPNNLKEIDIPLGSRIITVCDSIDAMVSKRPYRKALSWDVCKKEIIANKNIMYDPVVVDAAIEIWSKLESEFS